MIASKLNSDLTVIEQHLQNLQKIHQQICTAENDKDLVKIMKGLFKLQIESERLTQRARVMPYLLPTKNNIEKVKDTIILETDAFCRYTPEGWLELTIPGLLPKKQSGSGGYIRSIALVALERFFSENNRQYYACPMVVCFNHQYSMDRSERQYRDHDNFEINQVIDAIAQYVMYSDGPALLNHYYHSSQSDRNQTIITLVFQTKLEDYLKKTRQDTPGATG